MTDSRSKGMESETVAVAWTKEEAWLVYDLIAAKHDLLDSAEHAALSGLGAAPYRKAKDKLRAELTRTATGEGEASDG